MSEIQVGHAGTTTPSCCARVLFVPIGGSDAPRARHPARALPLPQRSHPPAAPLKRLLKGHPRPIVTLGAMARRRRSSGKSPRRSRSCRCLTSRAPSTCSSTLTTTSRCNAPRLHTPRGTRGLSTSWKEMGTKSGTGRAAPCSTAAAVSLRLTAPTTGRRSAPRTSVAAGTEGLGGVGPEVHCQLGRGAAAVVHHQGPPSRCFRHVRR